VIWTFVLSAVILLHLASVAWLAASESWSTTSIADISSVAFASWYTLEFEILADVFWFTADLSTATASDTCWASAVLSLYTLESPVFTDISSVAAELLVATSWESDWSKWSWTSVAEATEAKSTARITWFTTDIAVSTSS